MTKPALKQYQKDYRILDFSIFTTTNNREIIEILDENFLYPEKEPETPVRGRFRLEVKVVNNLEHVRSLDDKFHYAYDPAQDALLLTYLDRAIRVEISYTNRKITAQIEKIAFHYRAALGNWILTIPFAELVKEYHYYFMHSAALVKQGKALLLAGKSGKGKTTLAMSLLKMGWHYISDDEVYLYENNGFQVQGGSVKAKLTCRTWEMFTDILGEPDKFRGKRLIALDSIFPGKIMQQAGIAALCVISPAQSISLERLKPIEAVKELFSLAFLNAHPEYTRENFGFLTDFCYNIPCYRLNFTTDFAEMDRRLTEIILA